MSDSILVALVISVAPTLAAFASVIVSLKNSKRAERIEAKADVIQEHVNSTASEARAEIRSLQEQVRLLVENNAERKQTAALLAQSTNRERTP